MINRFLILAAVIGVLGCSTTDPFTLLDDAGAERHFSFSWDYGEARSAAPVDFANVRNLLDETAPMLALYREDLTHAAVEEFFISITGSPDIALPILYHAERAGISLSLVFSLAYVESRFAPDAVNINATSSDRGLFQLNSRTFRGLTEEDFFHPDVNTLHGIEYLEWCLAHTSSEEQALVAYNAGLSRARRNDVPQSTRVYISRIMAYRRTLNERFRTYIQNRFPSHAA